MLRQVGEDVQLDVKLHGIGVPDMCPAACGIGCGYGVRGGRSGKGEGERERRAGALDSDSAGSHSTISFYKKTYKDGLFDRRATRVGWHCCTSQLPLHSWARAVSPRAVSYTHLTLPTKRIV